MLRDRLQSIVTALPDGASVTVPVADLREWLEHDGDKDLDIVVDLTVDDVAQQLGRTPACVRGWCRAGLVPGAYRFNSREWRIPRAGLTAYIEKARDGQGSNGRSRPRRQRGADLGAWRDGL